MSFMQKFRIRDDNQPPPIEDRKFRFAPRWLAENQRTLIRGAVGLALGSFALNGYQYYKREQIPSTPPEVFAAIFDHDMTEIRIVNTTKLAQTDVEKAAEGVVRRLVYQLRRIETPDDVQEHIDTLYCTATGDAFDKADASFKHGRTLELQRAGSRRKLSERNIIANRTPGETWRDKGTTLTARWTEMVQDGARLVQVPMSGQFRVERFDHVDNKIRDCNVIGVMVTDYQITE